MDNLTAYAMYVIGRVESNHNWVAVNQNDPITLGLMQWFGQRAAEMLAKSRDADPTGWSAFAAAAPQLTADVEASHDWEWWRERYIHGSEVGPWQAFASRRAQHAAQEAVWETDWQNYVQLFAKWGVTDAKRQIFVGSMYHQSPAACGRVVSTVGGNATLELLLQTCLNDSILGIYSNRYNTVYELLVAWDGSSAPPDFGQSKPTPPGGDISGVKQPSSLITRIERSNGNQLIVYGRDGVGPAVYFDYTGNGLWLPSINANGSPMDGGYDPGGEGGVTSVVTLYTSWEYAFAYSQAPGRLDPVKTGYGDCSSTIWRAYMDAAGVDVGTWTGAMMDKGTEVWAGSGSGLPLDIMVPGDLLLIDWDGGEVDHVEMYIGSNQLLGHGGPGNGPYRKSDAMAYAAKAAKWYVRRYL